ncbi:MAG TPA: choice-of-anchor tandem repeat GloVer-containing protein [Verrucomicrobiae bacterium]|nr:choice-of-anchor tandem repeat GloVer-containing protein [Verrucomicrobiae bacterium]
MRLHLLFSNRLFLTASLASLLCGPAKAQPFSNLHSFAGDPSPEGAYPSAGLVLFGSTLFGTTDWAGVDLGGGTIFKINTDGTGFEVIYSFSPGDPPRGLVHTNVDGSAPSTRLVLSGATLYGTTRTGGQSANGTVFRINIDGSNFGILHDFSAVDASALTNADGARPEVPLVLSGDTLYGGTCEGGSYGGGTVFKIKTDGTEFATLHSFSALSNYPDTFAWTNADGNFPVGLTLSSGTLYGTTMQGGLAGRGVVFKVNTDGSGFAVVHNFSGTDLSFPLAPPALLGRTLYGSTYAGGAYNYGGLFKVNTDGTGLTCLHSFNGADGSDPRAGLTLWGDILFGTTFEGGGYGRGSVFKLRTDGTGFANLYSFPARSAGALPKSGPLVLSDGSLYGTTLRGGKSDVGTVFRLLVDLEPPRLRLTCDGLRVVLEWPALPAGYRLQAATMLGSGGDWQDVPDPPIEADGLNRVEISASRSSRFFRLRKN